MKHSWFSIRNQLLLLAAVATGSIWAGAFVQYRALQGQSTRLEGVQRDLNASLALAEVGRLAARERGLTNGWLQSTPARPVADLTEVRAALDASLADRQREAHALASAETGVGVAVAAMASDLARQRALADRHDIAPEALFGWYSRLIEVAYNRADRQLAAGMIDVGLPYEHVGHLLRTTEFLAQLRGLAQGALSAGAWSGSQHQAMLRALALHVEYRSLFDRTAPTDSLQRAGADLNGAALRNTLDTAQRLLDAREIHTLGVTPQAWWMQASEAVDTLQHLSMSESLHIKALAQARIEQLDRQMWLAVATLAVLGSVTLVLVLATVGRIVRGLAVLLEGIDNVATKRNLSWRFTHPRRDEFGQISTGVNKLVAMASGVVDEHERMSLTDALSGALNRRGLDAQLGARLNPARQHSGTLSLLMLDLDRFKRVNDELGHPAGDRVISQLAALLRQTVRPDDVVARYGGEEFVVLLGGCAMPEALKVAETLRHAVEAHDFGIGRPVTVSIGVSEGVPQETAAALIARADAALYRSKNAGRNSVTAAAPA